MTSIDVSIDSSLLSELSAGMSHLFYSQLFENTANNFERSADMVKMGWRRWVRGTGSLDGIKDIEIPDNKLSQTIKVKDVSEYSKYVYSDSQKMASLQQGHKEFDMKTKYPYGRKSRVSEVTKTPYLIIPFRWGTPNQNGHRRAHFRNVIPQELYIAAKTFRFSKVEERKRIEPNFRGELIDRATYTWGNRVTKDMTTERNAVGMVRMKGENGKAGGYFTFRIISAASPKNSWIRYKGGKPGIDIEGALRRTYENKIYEIMEKAIKEDLKNIEKSK